MSTNTTVMQCKDIPDRPVLEFLAKLKRAEIEHCYVINGRVSCFRPMSACAFPGTSYSVQNAMPGLDCDPNGKLARAKMGMLIRRGLVSGCTCGCRGDFELTEKGQRWLQTE